MLGILTDAARTWQKGLRNNTCGDLQKDLEERRKNTCADLSKDLEERKKNIRADLPTKGLGRKKT